MNRRILVTGAAGFIGSHVTQALLARGDLVVGLDNLNDYYAPERKEANLSEVIDAVSPGERFQFSKEDFRDRGVLRGLFERQTFEAVVHLGAMAGVRASVEDPHLYLDVNLVGTLNLLEAARGPGVGNFVFASTSSAYGNTQCLPFVETDPCDRPLAPYPGSNRAGRPARLVPAPMPDTDMAYTYADISKARRLLGYDPHISVAEGVTRFWDWYCRAVLRRA